ncbi:hypothetical protein HRR83_000580 [Exophiala dermatitidis]|uniref:Uncharacterized protein n=1 Tax=Exophiala dermatitidis TaxID=5970 RepID=A0AAN6F4G2_EXODE|nr:hypothetical protein HRR74_000582 [Exophiala dermatitidis]KAJ4528462.1 hypothetical protein HRR73_001085 [Exophiala dermatitidis]KAJ4531424.1 hypothetical protein HRR76_009080 [Exophiala dermatitidis]KAJ4558585.1 hypothetical protein HRR77_000580 [Exophiala dermatitidis]KAJ4581381.1 hypothetical protein HRR79_000416 [Exophiala dermatitidis]
MRDAQQSISTIINISHKRHEESHRFVERFVPYQPNIANNTSSTIPTPASSTDPNESAVSATSAGTTTGLCVSCLGPVSTVDASGPLAPISTVTVGVITTASSLATATTPSADVGTLTLTTTMTMAASTATTSQLMYGSESGSGSALSDTGSQPESAAMSTSLPPGIRTFPPVTAISTADSPGETTPIPAAATKITTTISFFTISVLNPTTSTSTSTSIRTGCPSRSISADQSTQSLPVIVTIGLLPFQTSLSAT